MVFVFLVKDGRTSNISIVSTESSELNSPRQSPTMEEGGGEPPELPTKLKLGNKASPTLSFPSTLGRYLGT